MARNKDSASDEKDTKNLTIPLPPDQFNEIKSLAKESERSTASMARILLREAMEARTVTAK